MPPYPSGRRRRQSERSMDVPRLVAQLLYLFAPLLFSMALGGIVLRFELLQPLRRPIDAGRSLAGRRIFGDSKTWRGAFVALIACVIAVAIQKYLVGARAAGIALVDYAHVQVLPFGTAMGVGASLGELPNSFVKRRLGIAPGKTAHGPLALIFYVWDQVDALTIIWPLLSYWLRPTLLVVLSSLVLALLLHPILSLLGYAIGARKTAR
ncbi:MAG TPA: CDP-archaeol synthase [Polyangiales bacterium]